MEIPGIPNKPFSLYVCPTMTRSMSNTDTASIWNSSIWFGWKVLALLTERFSVLWPVLPASPNISTYSCRPDPGLGTSPRCTDTWYLTTGTEGEGFQDSTLLYPPIAKVSDGPNLWIDNLTFSQGLLFKTGYLFGHFFKTMFSLKDWISFY